MQCNRKHQPEVIVVTTPPGVISGSSIPVANSARTIPERRGDREIEYVEATLDDVALVNSLAHKVLGRSLDEPPPQTRRPLGLVAAMVDERRAGSGQDRNEVGFTRKELRDATGWGDTQLKVHLRRLIELEHVLVRQAGVGRRTIYELLFDGDAAEDAPRLAGLIDVDELRRQVSCDHDRAGSKSDRAGVGRPPVDPRSGGGRTAERPGSASDGAGSRGTDGVSHKNGVSGPPSTPSIAAFEPPAEVR